MSVGELSVPESTPTVPQSAGVVEMLGTQLDAALDQLGEAKAFAKSTYQTEVFQIADTLLTSDTGIAALYERADRFDATGVFSSGPWETAARLQPPLVAGSLRAGGIYRVVESLSELRMLAIAMGRLGDELDQKQALTFLHEVMALNLDFIFPTNSEAERTEAGPHRDSNLRVFRFVVEHLGLDSLRDDVIAEIEQICAQRPVMTRQVSKMIDLASRIPSLAESEHAGRLEPFIETIHGAGPLSKANRSVADYRQALKLADEGALHLESAHFAETMKSTGLTSTHHAVLLRHLIKNAPELLAVGLGLNQLGAAELAQNEDLVHRLIRVAILPATSEAIYGLSRILELGLLSRQEIAVGLNRLIDLDLQADVKRNLLARREVRDGATANSLLVAGVIAVFGQPLGVGQGFNPTCQAARAISLWAQHAHGYLLKLLISAARDGFVELDFEGERLKSSELVGGVATSIDFDLDAVSVVLTPHLDVVYDAMMRRVVLRVEDGHKWVNPALYGRWVPQGFASVFLDRAQTTVSDYDEFLRRFFATHHPAYNEVDALMYPNPVGILVTNAHGDYLGPHAVSLQRVTTDPQGELRAYFFNPNNEGRQDWGHGVKPSIRHHGEIEGESSLKFRDFAARLYAFHYNPYEEGEAYAVPLATIQEIEAEARSTWGKAFAWAV